VPPLVAHSAAVFVLHDPSFAQQAPVAGGCGQGFGSQTVPSPLYVPAAVPQAASVMTAQLPSLEQQAPMPGGWGQGFGEQVVLSP